MKKPVAILAVTAFSLILSSSVFAAGVCPQERKTKAAPANIAAMDETAAANQDRGKTLYEKDVKPIACKNCHGDTGGGDGKLGVALKPPPLNFTCAETMKTVSAGQMFFIIKSGSQGTGMPPHEKTLADKDIWDLVKYIRSAFMK